MHHNELNVFVTRGTFVMENHDSCNANVWNLLISHIFTLIRKEITSKCIETIVTIYAGSAHSNGNDKNRVCVRSFSTNNHFMESSISDV